MKIGYCLILSPFQYGVSYLNDNLNCIPPNHKLINLFGTVTRVVSKSTCKIKLSISIDNSGAGGFDYTLQVANKFDSLDININLYNISFEQMCLMYQNNVFYNYIYKSFWSCALTKMNDIEHDNIMYKPNFFQKVHNLL